MQRIPISLALVLALGLSAEHATALGLGKVTSTTTLGQPLGFAVALRLDPGDTIEAKCVKAEVSLGDRVLPEAGVRTLLETAADGSERRIRVTTTVPVDEPVVSISLHIGCPVQLSRSFVVFADPPLRGANAANTAAAQGTWAPARSESAVDSVVDAVPPSRRASIPAAPPRARQRSSETSAPGGPPTRAGIAAAPDAAEISAAPRSRVRRAASTAPPRPAGGPVLRLDPVEADVQVAPSLQMSTALSEVPPAAPGVTPRALDPEHAERFQERERLKALEAALLTLRSDSQDTQKALADMQSRVRAAEASRYANPLVYLLAAFSAVLAVGLAVMLWLRRREPHTGAWWAAPAGTGTPPPAPPAEEPLEALPPDSADMEQAVEPEPKLRSLVTPMPMFATPEPFSSPSRSPEPEAGGVELRRPMSAEELIDLEQQAEFFVVLGQDDAAIDLLMGHVRSTGGVSPLPYLKLLEIYRRRGEREPYDRIRERFNRRFNAYAPEWDVDPETGLSLDGYPEVMGRLQRAWAAPSQAMDLLDASLFRRDAGPTFDVPAYRELLFLYGMARDLAERDVSPEGVDLLLPLNDEAATLVSSVPASRSPPSPSTGLGLFQLDLDVSSDPPPRLSLDDPDFKRSSR